MGRDALVGSSIAFSFFRGFFVVFAGSLVLVFSLLLQIYLFGF
jgi:hypothetical protein